MKKILTTLFCLLMMGVAIAQQPDEVASKMDRYIAHEDIDITGVWQSITYFDDSPEPSVDTFIILNFQGKYGIVCTSYQYFGVNDIHRQRNSIEFTMLNSLQDDDIYILKFKGNIVNTDKITMSFQNNKGQTETNITWYRLKDY